MDRRGFLQNVAAIAVGGATCLRDGQARETVAAAKPRRATLAQIVVHKNVEQNLTNARRMAALHQRLALTEMTKHEFLDPKYRKERTTFSDGTTVTVDWDANQVTIEPDVGPDR